MLPSALLKTFRQATGEREVCGKSGFSFSQVHISIEDAQKPLAAMSDIRIPTGYLAKSGKEST